jgi:hypothetical protein
VRWSVRTVIGWALVALLAGAILWATGRGSAAANVRVLKESAIIALFVAVIGGRADVRHVFQALPSCTRWLLWAGLLGSVLAQLLLMLQASYPFLAWSMYGAPARPADERVFIFEGVTAGGAASRLVTSRLFPAIPGFELDWRLHQLLSQETPPEEVDRILRFLAARHNRRAPADRWEKVLVYAQTQECDRPAHPFVGRHELLREVRLE